ncbi:MAG: VOC family protein [Desulfobacterales bacterium]|nr:MAG: VOC family protein [Desulfobacterales bacterium]
MINRIDHISIAVKDYDNARHFFQNVLGAIPGANAKDNNMRYAWQMFSFGDLSRLELIHATEQGGFLDSFFKKHKNGGLHHMTLQTPDIKKAKKILRENNIPYFGYNEYGDIWKEIFIHPNDAFGVLIQIAEFCPNDWLNPSLVLPKGKKWEVKKGKKGFTLGFAHPGGGKVHVKLTTAEVKQLINDLI